MGDEYILVNSIQGSFHQGNVEKFGDTAGRQYTCMALFAIAYASFKRLGILQKCDLDVILMNGVQLCKSLDRTDYLSVIDLSQTFQVGSVRVNVEYNINKYGTLTNGTVSTEELSEIFRPISDKLQEKNALFFVQGFCFAMFFRNHILYIFDSHSRNSMGFQTTSGASVLPSFLSYDHLSAHIHQCYICNVGDGSDSNRELQHEIQYVKISTTRQFVN